MSNSKVKDIKKPNKIIYNIAYFICFLFFKGVYKLKIDKAEMKEVSSPFILLSNHICNIDFLITAIAAYPYKLNIVTGSIYFRMKMLRWLLELMGCIPKEQFVRDFKIIKDVYKVKKRGGNVAIFPAGQSSFTGESTYIDPSIAKLVKKMNIPVIGVVINGAHIAFPKWNMIFLRKSRIEVKISPILMPKEMQNMSYEEIYNKIVDSIYFDDYEWQKKNMIASSNGPRSPKGIERVLFRCPNCKAEFNMETEGNELFCTECGNAALMDEYGLLKPQSENYIVFDTPTKWNRWQYEEYEKEVNDDFIYAEVATLKEINPNGREKEVGEGIVTLDVKSITYMGTYNGENVKLVAKNDVSSMLSHEKKVSFNVMFNRRLYNIAPKNGRTVFKFVMLKEIIYKKYYAKREKNIR